jgi:hypothetical protein
MVCGQTTAGIAIAIQILISVFVSRAFPLRLFGRKRSGLASDRTDSAINTIAAITVPVEQHSLVKVFVMSTCGGRSISSGEVREILVLLVRSF